MKALEALKNVDAILDNLSRELEGGFSDRWLEYLSVASRFHRYSYSNQMLIYSQRPMAGDVAGFHKWKELGRSVKKGAKGIAILAPTYKKMTVSVTNEQTGEEETSEIKAPRFRVVYVFDIADTEKTDPNAPEVDWKVAIGRKDDGTPEQYAALVAFANSLGVTVRIGDTGNAGGYTNGVEIVMEKENVGTLAHELGHVLCHFRSGRRDGMTNQEKELEAESVAYIVCEALGVDRAEASKNYILNWKGDSKRLREHATHIQKAALEILNGITPQAEQEQHAEAA